VKTKGSYPSIIVVAQRFGFTHQFFTPLLSVRENLLAHIHRSHKLDRFASRTWRITMSGRGKSVSFRVAQSTTCAVLYAMGSYLTHYNFVAESGREIHRVRIHGDSNSSPIDPREIFPEFESPGRYPCICPKEKLRIVMAES
jgi:hypothetical protein